MIARRTLNQSLMRCINTSVTTLLPIFSMLIVGGYLLDQPLLVDFSRALIIGLVLGVYSSLFVASPIEMVLKEREQRWAEIRTRLVNKGVDVCRHPLARPQVLPWPPCSTAGACAERHPSRRRTAADASTSAATRPGRASPASAEAAAPREGSRGR